MIYDVRSDYYQGFMSTKQGSMVKEKKAIVPSTAPASSDADAMETE
jgi:hypothetical protein